MARKKLEVSVVRMTPKQAQELLDESLKKGTNVRRLSERMVERLVRDIEAGNWSPGAASIKTNSKGLLIDGQHRLAAIAKSGRTLQVVWFQNVDREECIDQGYRRTAAQLLKQQGVAYPIVAAAVARSAWRYDEGGINGLVQPEFVPTASEVMETYANNMDGIDHCVTASISSDAVGWRGVVTSTVYIGMKIREETIGHEEAWAEAAHFLRLFSLANPDEEELGRPKSRSPRLLRDRLLREKSKKMGKLTRQDVIKLSVLAWNAWVGRRPIKMLVPGKGMPELVA